MATNPFASRLLPRVLLGAALLLISPGFLTPVMAQDQATPVAPAARR